MEKQDKYPQKQGGRRTFSITLGLPTFLGGIAVLCGGFVFVFILGLLLGSGYDVESRIPAIQRMMPEKAPGQAPVVVAESEGLTASSASGSGEGDPAAAQENAAKTAPQEQAGAQNATAKTAASAGGVMDQGDLAYRDTLKSGQGRPAQQNARDKKAEADKKKAEADKKKADADKKAAAEKSRKEAAEKPKAASGEQCFHYVYQAAAYKDKESADKYTATLKADGLKARTDKSVEKGVTWYRVVLDFTGTPDETDTLRAKMRARGVPKILIRSKTPVR